MSGRGRGVALPKSLDVALRELVNALGKAAMYPAGHRFVTQAAQSLAQKLRTALAERDTITIGVTPRGLLLDGQAIEPLPMMLREFAVRLHRKNVGTVQFTAGLTDDELAAMLGGLAASDADETVGRDGIRLLHVRVEPLVYDVLAFADPTLDHDLDDVFWLQLVEAAFGRRLADDEGAPSATQIAEAISERAAASAEGARRVYEALASFSSAIAVRGERAAGSARKRFVEVLSALSRPTTTRVVAAAPSTASRRRFLRETLSLVPAALLMQLLESVAEADGEPISPQLRFLLGKLAGQGSGEGIGPSTGGFATQVLSLVEQWDGAVIEDDEEADPRLGMEPARVVAMGLDLATGTAPVTGAARMLAARGQLAEVLQLMDHPENDPATVRALADAVLDPGLLQRLLAATPLDFPLIERVAMQTGAASVGHLLDTLGKSEDRGTRRKLLDILVRVGPAAETELMGRLQGAPWYLQRNILAVLAQFPTITDAKPIFAALADPELRVRQEALKVLLKQPGFRDRAIADTLEQGEETTSRLALGALGASVPPSLVAQVLGMLSHPSEELRLQSVRLLAGAANPLVVPQLLSLVRTRGGFLRRQRLMPKSPVMLAALEVLARRWSNHRPVLAVLQLAAKANDQTIRDVVGGKG